MSIGFELSEDIRRRLVGARVVALYLFGSRATGHATEASDFDFAVMIDDPMILKDVKRKQRRYVELYDILTDAIGRHVSEPVVDIAFLQDDISLELKAHVVKTGVLILDREPNLRANLEAMVMERAADFAPLLREMDDVILDRV